MSEAKPLLSLEHMKKNGLEGTELDSRVRGSLINLLPQESLAALERIHIEMFTKDENELQIFCNPTPSVNRVRHAFWNAVHKAREGKASSVNYKFLAMAAGVSYQSLMDMLTTPKKLVWILCPLITYDSLVQEGLERGLRRMREALESPIHQPDGALDTKALSEIRKIVEFLDKRQHGEFTQNINLKSKNHTVTEHSVHNYTEDKKSLAQVEEEIKALEAQLGGGSAQIEDKSAEDKHEQLRSAARERGIKVKVKEA